MKKKIITWSIIFASILVLGVIFVAVSPNESNVIPETISQPDLSQPITFTTLDNSVTFDSTQVPQLLKLFNYADILALNNDTYSDSSIMKNIGIINRYKFVYHYVYVMSGQAKFHGIIVYDTIMNKEIYITRFDKFADNILKYNECYINNLF